MPEVPLLCPCLPPEAHSQQHRPRMTEQLQHKMKIHHKKLHRDLQGKFQPNQPTEGWQEVLTVTTTLDVREQRCARTVPGRSSSARAHHKRRLSCQGSPGRGRTTSPSSSGVAQGTRTPRTPRTPKGQGHRRRGCTAVHSQGSKVAQKQTPHGEPRRTAPTTPSQLPFGELNSKFQAQLQPKSSECLMHICNMHSALV